MGSRAFFIRKESKVTEENQSTESNESVNIFEVTDIHQIRTMYCNQQAEIAVLKDKLGVAQYNLKITEELAEKRRNQHESDIAKISEALIEAADERDWCSEYDSFIGDLNNELYLELSSRKRDYELTVRVTRTVYADVTITVEATSEDEAEALFDEETYVYLDDLPRYISDWEEEDEEVDIRDTRRA